MKRNKMNKPFNRRKPVIGRRASVCNMSLSIKVLWKSQLDRLIVWLTKNDYEFSWTIERDDSIIQTTYVLTIIGIHWAKNLRHIQRVLERCDYQD